MNELLTAFELHKPAYLQIQTYYYDINKNIIDDGGDSIDVGVGIRCGGGGGGDNNSGELNY